MLSLFLLKVSDILFSTLVNSCCFNGAINKVDIDISNTGIFVAIDNNTLHGSKLSIFLLCQNSLGY